MNAEQRLGQAVGVQWFAGAHVRDLRYDEFLCGLWASACEALGVPASHTVRSSNELRELLPTWADERIGDTPRQPSSVSDDGFPAELSLNWSGGNPELRVLFDCLSDTPRVRAALAATSHRFGQISDLFAAAPLWYSMAWRPPSRIVHKAYFELGSWPAEQRFAALGQAMERLGLAQAWDDARRRVEEDGQARQREVEFLGLDLGAAAESRTKIYYRNHEVTIRELNRMASVALDHNTEAALAAYHALAGDRPDAGKGALTCLAFRSGVGRAAESTTYLRMSSLASCDQKALDLTADLLRHHGVDPRPLRTVATALAPARLAESQGFLELVSYRAARRRGDITTYFRFPVYDQPAPSRSHPPTWHACR